MLPCSMDTSEEYLSWEQLFALEGPSVHRAREARESQAISPPRKAQRKERLDQNTLTKEQKLIEQLLKVALSSTAVVRVDAPDVRSKFERQSLDAVVVDSPPATPRTPRPKTAKGDAPFTPPPFMRNSCLPKPALMKALMSNSVDKVQAVLEDSPGCALDLFWEFELEPPLCFAVRTGCSPRIVQLLIEHGADVELTDSHGRTALETLHLAALKTNDVTHDWFMDSNLFTTTHANHGWHMNPTWLTCP